MFEWEFSQSLPSFHGIISIKASAIKLDKLLYLTHTQAWKIPLLFTPEIIPPGNDIINIALTIAMPRDFTLDKPVSLIG